jgi:hypothetical protein
MNKRRSYAGFSFFALALALAVLTASVLAIAPHLHQRVHGAAQHECVVSLIAAGKYDHAPTTAQFVFAGHWVREVIFLSRHLQLTTPALEFSLLEHAPPTIS